MNLVEQVLALDVSHVVDEVALRAVASHLELVSLARGQRLFNLGDPGDALYLLLNGRLLVVLPRADGSSDLVNEIEPGATVGEMALLTGESRNATVLAAVDSHLVRLSRSAFEELASSNPEGTRRFARSVVSRLQRIQLVHALSRLFGQLEPQVIRDFGRALQWRHLHNGEWLFQQGEPSDALYIVINGRLRALQTNGGKTTVLGEVSRGESVGETGILLGEPRSASVQAIRDTDLVVLGARAFDDLVVSYPNSARELARVVAKRTRLTAGVTSRAGSTVNSIAVVGASPNVPVEEFARRLVDELQHFAATLRLDSAQLNAVFGQIGIAQVTDEDPISLMLTNWLNERELTHRYIVYQADPTWSPWTRRCVRQSDRILVIAKSKEDPTPAALEAQLEQLGATGTRELVLLQDACRHPVGTLAWLGQRQVACHHHVRLGNQGDIARLARRLTGRALGLVLGGGGARGLAHIGVIRALEEADLHPDIIGGTSAGALFGAFYAFGMTTKEMCKTVETFGSRRTFVDWTVPIISLFRGKKLSAILQKIFEDTAVEDLWYPFFCISSNLTQAAPKIHKEGLLWRSVRASISLPAVFSPVVDHNGDLLVDGGVLNNLPIDIMREATDGGPVVAVSVSPERDLGIGYVAEPNLSGWKILWRRMRGEQLPTPSLFRNLMRTMEINDTYQRHVKRQMADVFISPQLNEFSILDFTPFERIVEIGYRAGQEAITSWKEGTKLSKSASIG